MHCEMVVMATLATLCPRGRAMDWDSVCEAASAAVPSVEAKTFADRLVSPLCSPCHGDILPRLSYGF